MGARSNISTPASAPAKWYIYSKFRRCIKSKRQVYIYISDGGEGIDAFSIEAVDDLGPYPTEVTLQSANGIPLTPEFSSDGANLESRTWTIRESTNNIDYTEVSGSPFTDTSVAASQSGATPYSPPNGTFTDGSYYKVKTRYNAQGAPSLESAEITFRTNTNRGSVPENPAASANTVHLLMPERR